MASIVLSRNFAASGYSEGPITPSLHIFNHALRYLQCMREAFKYAQSHLKAHHNPKKAERSYLLLSMCALTTETNLDYPVFLPLQDLKKQLPEHPSTSNFEDTYKDILIKPKIN